MNKLLFVRYKKSKNILEGGEQGSQKNYNVLAKILGEGNIDTIYVHDENVKRTPADYIRGLVYIVFDYFFGLTPARVADIVGKTDEYDYFFIDRSIFGIIAKKARQRGYKGQIICFFHNVEKFYFNDKLSKYVPWRKLVIRCADKNDKYSCTYADKIIALNERDKTLIEKCYGRKADVLIPVAFKDKYKMDSYPTELTNSKPLCVFLGGYFPPNNEGIEWFVKNVYPHVNVSIRIVGKGMNKIRSHGFITPEIEVVSDAPDLLPHFEEADIMVLPIFKGAGMKVKTCESLMYGKNIIATDEAFEGYALDYSKVGGKCNTADEFISLIHDFESNPRPRFNAYSRSIFLEKYSEEAVEERFSEVLN